ALAAVPLIYPAIPPLVDLLGHMGRFRVELGLESSPWLQRYYDYHWAAIGNLGVDLLVMVLGPLIGLEPAVKLIVMIIPPLTVAGFLWVAREVHGRVPPTAYFAIPFAFGHPFLFGFVNFALAMALAFLAFGLWLRLGRLGKLRLREWLFVPISLIVFFTHTFGWGALGLLCFSAEAVRQHDRGIGWLRAGVNAALQASVMLLPVLIMVVWRSETHGVTTADMFNFKAKLVWLKTALRDRWQWFDIAGLVAVALVLLEALRNRRLTFSRNLAFSALVLVAGFVMLPRIIFGSAYADMRLVPYFIAVLLLAIRFRGATTPRLGCTLAALAFTFVVVRLGANTASLAMAANDQQAKLAAINHMPMGARVMSMVGLRCGVSWPLPRNSHLGAMVVVRRDGFSNDQWLMEGLNLLELKYRAPGYFSTDPSEIVRPDECGDRLHLTIGRSLRAMPRDAFDYLWLIDPPVYDPRDVADMTPVWRGPGSILYRVKP
ncbi:MAG: hypothetical protein ABIS38_09730, partial [Sphingomicrobium sp.]